MGLEQYQKDFSENISSNRLRFCFSPVYKKRFVDLQNELGLSNRELLYFLIDNVNVEETKSLSLFRKKLNKKIKQGVGLDYIIQLKLLYTTIEIFLKKINYL